MQLISILEMLAENNQVNNEVIQSYLISNSLKNSEQIRKILNQELGMSTPMEYFACETHVAF
ncbi:hypothetical protein [Legionella jordanis]|uniref:Uncharacterized protein n=1 Tax=Legionella jordanis TaxID=456 RepID=A0A0W0VCV2_9GAMM|nr:hypothetical protein [Legionella jordanis]KTD17919.1 hypothetical protein Ljor_2225 [Legionella jordanis]RMX02383.1 hypothetical protein EAW55_09035 [Legionella jordanis]RMX21775.1 hypothetical protein EAS68_03190 [Legionella jordanis]VEH13990.1 Uncharacterised protein [Legionella jordanis]